MKSQLLTLLQFLSDHHRMSIRMHAAMRIVSPQSLIVCKSVTSNVRMISSHTASVHLAARKVALLLFRSPNTCMAAKNSNLSFCKHNGTSAFLSLFSPNENAPSNTTAISLKHQSLKGKDLKHRKTFVIFCKASQSQEATGCHLDTLAAMSRLKKLANPVSA